jgi:anti-sigma28 factor (negative regulator of flagellin synthesis)
MLNFRALLPINKTEVIGMEIKSINGFFSDIRQTSASRDDSLQNERAESFGKVLRGKMDTVEISAHKTERSVLKETRNNVLRDLKRPADDATLKNLKERIASGTYSVNIEEIAAILGR